RPIRDDICHVRQGDLRRINAANAVNTPEGLNGGQSQAYGSMDMDQTVGGQTVVKTDSPLSESEKNAIIGGVLLSMLLAALDQTVIGDLVPPRERARYSAWIAGTWAVASIAGPLLGGTFAEHLHWSLIFWINLPLGLIAMAIINKPLRKLPIAAKHHRIDG